jgi:hypothetical protein
MNRQKLRSGILCLIGLAMIVVGVAAAVIQLAIGEGSHLALLCVTLLVLPESGTGVVALGASLAGSRHRKFLYAALGMTVCGMTTGLLLFALYLFSPYPWWAYAWLAYPAGLIMSLVGSVYVARESFRGLPVSGGTAEKA